jgi:hypothetical protein
MKAVLGARKLAGPLVNGRGVGTGTSGKGRHFTKPCGPDAGWTSSADCVNPLGLKKDMENETDPLAQLEKETDPRAQFGQDAIDLRLETLPPNEL